MTAPESSRLPIGSFQGVAFDVVRWVPADADVDLSFACMFEHEAPGATMTGGLLHLDQALGGALSTLRAEGLFRAEEMETLFVASPPPSAVARSIMVIGFGDPATVSHRRLERATRVAAREAIRLKARSVAFAPDLLDGGLAAGRLPDAPAAMMRGVVGALQAERRLADLGLAPPPILERWSFDVGQAGMETVADAMSAAL